MSFQSLSYFDKGISIVERLRCVTAPHIAMQLPDTTLLQEDKRLLGMDLELSTMIANFGVRDFSHGLIVAIELIVAE